ncbi:hypothetical protein GQ42DRAFT_152343 [Ramicandelaber brevisporus]|nr:hypothetical protein GQ42DRAFT_152343 [Ramicandelaber brevisporus]
MPNSNQLVSVRITDSRLSVSLFTDIITIVIIYFYTMRLHTALVLLCCTKFVESQDFIVLKDSKSAAVEPSGRLAVSSPLNFIVIQTPSVQLQSAQSATGAAVSSQPTSTVSSTVTVVTTSTSTSTLTTALSSSGSGGGSGNADSATSTTSTTSAQMTQLADQAVTSARGISIITTTISVTATNSPSPIALPMPTILTISVSQTAPPQTITIQQQQAAVPQAPPFQTPFPAYLPGGGGGGGGVAMHPAPVVQPLQAPAYPQPMAPPMAPLAGAAAAAPVYGQQLPPPVIIPTITVQQQMPPPMAPMAPMAPQPAASAPLAPQPAAAAPFAAPQPPVAQPLIAPLQATATGTTTSPAVPPLPSDVLQFPFPAGKYRGGDDYGGYGGYGNRHNRYNDEYMLMKPNAAAVNALLADPAPFTTRNPLPVLRATQTEVVTVGGQMAMRGSTVVLDPPRPGIVEVFEDFFLGTPAKSYLVPGGSGGSGGGGMHTVRAAALKSGGNVAMALEQQKEQAEQEPHVFTMEINNHYSDNNGNGNGNGSNERFWTTAQWLSSASSNVNGEHK